MKAQFRLSRPLQQVVVLDGRPKELRQPRRYLIVAPNLWIGMHDRFCNFFDSAGSPVANIPLIKKNLNPLSFMDVDQETYVKSLLGVYEKNDVSLFRDLYLWAYKRSCQRYSAIQQTMGELNLLKLKYRTEIQGIIRGVILEKIAGPQVVHRIQNLMEAKKLPGADAAELFKLIGTKIVSLHDGNIARFKIRPSDFQEWKSLQ